jgi:hypothetical protein
LNRTEYTNAIRDLLALNIDATTFLPPDDSSHGFDNMAGTLTTSPALMEAYLSAAGKISRLSVGTETAPTLVDDLASDLRDLVHPDGEHDDIRVTSGFEGACRNPGARGGTGGAGMLRIARRDRDVVAGTGEAGSQRGAHVTGADDRDVHIDMSLLAVPGGVSAGRVISLTPQRYWL